MDTKLVTTQKSEKNKQEIIGAINNLENALLKTNLNQEMLLKEILNNLLLILKKIS